MHHSFRMSAKQGDMIHVFLAIQCRLRVTRLQIDLEALRRCPSYSERIFEDMCGVNTEDVGFPIPAIPLSAFPRTAKVVMSLEQKYKALQRFNHVPLAWFESGNGTD